MMKTEHKNLNRFRNIISIFYLIILILFVNTRIDLHPNTILINADHPSAYLPPEIELNTGLGFEGKFVKPGENIHKLNSKLKSFRFVFSKQQLLENYQFKLKDYQVIDGTEITHWETILAGYKYLPESTTNLIIKTSDTDASYRIHIGQTEWPVEENGNYLVAEKPGQTEDNSGILSITKSNQLRDDPKDIRGLTLSIETITALTDHIVSFNIRTISLVKNFGRLGIKVPIKVWEAGEIPANYYTLNPDASIKLENNNVLIKSPEDSEIILSYQGSLSNLNNEAGATIRNYMIIVNLAAIISAIILNLFLGLVTKQFLRFKQRNFKNNKYFSGVDHTVQDILKNKPIQWIKLNRLFLLLILILTLASIISNYLGTLQMLVFIVLISALILFWIIMDHLYSNHKTIIAIRNFLEIMGKREFFLVIFLLVIALFLLSFRMGTYDFLEDEFQVVSAAAGYLKSGEYLQWDWINKQMTNNPYERAWPHTFIIAQSFRLFGISEQSARLVSVISGLVFFVIFYYFARFFTNKHIALLSLLSAVLYITFLTIFRYTRMYALLLPLFLALTYSIYRALTGEWWISTKINFLDNLISQYLNFDYRFVLLTLPLLYLNYHIHYNSLIIILAAYIFIILMAMITRSKKYILLTIIGLVGIIGLYFVNTLNLTNKLPWVLGLITFFNVHNDIYLNHLLRRPFGTTAGLAFMLFLIYNGLISKKKSADLYKYMYLFVIVITAAIFFIYVADRYPSIYYISHILPVAIILIIAGFWQLVANFSSLKIPIIVLITLILLFNFGINAKGFFDWERGYGDFSTAYQVIIDNYNNEEEVVFGQYLRTYYLQSLDNIRQISMLNYKKYTLTNFLDDLDKYDAGWITWETRKGYHIDDEIIAFVDANFQKLHGTGVDDTKVEVYYFSTEHLQDNTSID